jgi:PAS domain S-box-containing protein
MKSMSKKIDNFIFDPRNYNVLIVDDSKSTNFIVKKVFATLNYNCHCAFSISQAQEILSSQKIDYVILDIHLPDGNGFEIIKQLEDDTSIKIFVLTTEADKQFRDITYQKGVIDFIEKKGNFLYKVGQLPSSVEQLEKNKFKTILVVDDSLVIQQQLKALLENRNYSVQLADDANIAWEIIQNNSIDLMLLDLHLKHSYGLDFLTDKHVEIVDQRKIPVMIISGSLDASIVRDGLKAGAVDILSKPYIAEEVMLKVDLWIDYRQKEDDVLRSSQLLEQYKSAVDRSAMVSKADPKGKITYVNDEFCSVTGYTKEEVLGKSHNIVKDPEADPQIFKTMWTRIQKLKKPWQGELRNISKNGEPYWVNSIINPILNSKGDIIEYIAIRNDITEQKQKELEIRAMHKHTKDSIEYASMIQSSVLPNSDTMRKYFSDQFVIWHPKDTVGGDIYLFNELKDNNECLLMYIDCTGHGVPGAFVTMLVKAVEAQILSEISNEHVTQISPAWIMGYFNKALKKLLQQENKDSISNVGWDGGIIHYNKKTKKLKFAGAETPLFYIDEQGEFKTIKGNRYSVGYKKCDANYEYKETVLDVKEGMKFYCTTDGYLDQNGGSKDFPFGKKRFGNIIKQYHNESMADQQTILLNEMMEYEGMIKNNDRNDDMTVIGFTI